MIFNPKHKKKIQTFWIVFSLLIIVSMVLLYIPSLYR
jgi:hypothetical protein